MFKWTEVALTKTAEFQVPNESGLYVIKDVHRVMGLPVIQEIVYVGKSKNLRRRFKEHCNPRSEHNQKLFSASIKKDLEFWFAEVEVESLDELEKSLIEKMIPKTNIQRYGVTK